MLPKTSRWFQTLVRQLFAQKSGRRRRTPNHGNASSRQARVTEAIEPRLLLTTLATFDFESEGGYQLTNPNDSDAVLAEVTDGGGDYYLRTDGSDISGAVEYTAVQGSFYFGVQDTDGDTGVSAIDQTFDTVSINGATNLVVSILVAEDDSADGAEDWDGTSGLKLEYSIDGGAFQSLLAFESEGGTNTQPRQDTDFDGIGDGTALTPTFQTFTATIPDTGTSLVIRARYESLNAGDEDVAIDNLVISGDTAIPSLSSISRQSPANALTNADSLVFRATFSEDVQNVDASDFAVTGTTATAALTQVDGATYDITVSGGDLAGLNGSVGINLAPAQDIQDPDGNVLPTLEPLVDETYLLDNLAPSISSLAPVDEAVDVLASSDLMLHFDEDIQVGTGNITIHRSSDDSVAQAIDVTGSEIRVDGGIVTIDPPVDLATNTAYYVNVPASAFVDAAGNAFSGIADATTWNFATSDLLTVTFQQGVNGYSGTFDRLINLSNSVNGADVDTTNSAFFIDGDPNDQSRADYLIRFDDILGGAGIPAGAVILDASLTLRTTSLSVNAASPTAESFSVYRLTQGFDTDSTLDGDFGDESEDYTPNIDGVDTTEADFNLATFHQEVGEGGLVADEFYSASVTRAVQSWVDGDTNHGLAVLSDHVDNDDGWSIHSTGSANAAFRPELTVVYSLDPTVKTAEFQQGLNGYTGTTDIFLRQEGATIDGSTVSEGFLDGDNGSEGGSNDDPYMLRFDLADLANADEIIKAELIIKTGISSASSDSLVTGPTAWGVHQLLTGFTKTSEYGDFAGDFDDMLTANQIAPHVALFEDIDEAELMSADITSIVANWIEGGESNEGIYIGTHGTENGWQIFSSGAAFSHLAPMLRVTYHETASTPGITISETEEGTSVNETGTTDTFSVVLDSQPVNDVVLTVNSADTGEATVDKSTLTFTSSNWDTPQIVTVSGVDDAVVDGDQTTAVTIAVDAANSDDTYDAVGDEVVQVTTTDGSTIFAIQAVAADKSEGNSGNTEFTFTVTREGDTSGTNNVTYAVSGATINGADAGDFSSGLASGTLTFTAGETSQTLTINVSGDTEVEADEGFIVTLSNPGNGASITTGTADGTIRNDDIIPPEFAISATDASRAEGQSGTTDFTFTVTRSANTTGSDTVNFAVTGAAVDAVDATDFVGGVLPTGTVNFADTDTTQTITISVAGDTTPEANEGFIVTLSNPSRGGTLSSATAEGTILDDDTPPANVWINEFHYDNASTDVDEFVEIAGESGVDLTGYTVVQYNGSNGSAYGTPIALSGNIDDEGSGFGALSFMPTSAFQNGNDGLALVDDRGRVLDFISYEGAFTAADGPASGMTAVDVGVEESGSGPEGVSLQRDNLAPASNNAWKGPFTASPGDLNVIPAPEFSITALDAVKAEGESGDTPFTFTVTRDGDTSGVNDVSYSVTGAATDGADAADFNGGLASGTLSFVAGETSQTITINVNGDTDVEADEGFSVTLLNATNGATIIGDFADGIIQNDDVAPAVLTVMIDQASISENGGSTTGTVSIPSNATSNLQVSLFVDDPSEASVSTPVTIAVGTNSATFTVTGQDDALLDGTKTVTVSASASGFVDGSDTIDVTDDEAAAVQMLINEVLMDPPEVADTGLEYIELRGTANGILPADSYLVLLEGDAESNPGNIDHVFSLGGQQFDSNGFLLLEQTGGGWTQPFSSRTTDIENGSVSFLLVTSSTAPTPDTDVDANDDGTLDGSSSSWTILDSIGNIEGGANDTGYGLINVSGDGQGLTPAGSILVDISAQPLQTSLYHPDYVGRNGDSEGSTQDDWVFAEIDGTSPNYTLAVGATAPSHLGGAPLNHRAATNDFIPPNTLLVNITPTQLNEDSGTTTVTLSRTQADISAELEVTIAVSSGRASATPTTVTIPAGQASATFTLDAVDNSVDDGDEVVTVTASAATFTDGTDTVEILDDDVQALAVDPVSISVPEGGSQTFGVALAFEPTSDVTVNVSISGDGDLSLGSTSLTFTSANWDTVQNVSVNAAEDADVLDGTVTITIASTGVASVDVSATEDDNDAPELTGVLISEFQPNAKGTDPDPASFEIDGGSANANASFDLWVVSIESDGADGRVDRAANVTGTFDGDGLAVVSIPDLENPSFTVVLANGFTGAVGTDVDTNDDGTADDLSAFNGILDAIGIPDATGDEASLYGVDFGGQDFSYTGDEPQLVFREAVTGDWYAVNEPSNGDVVALDGTAVSGTEFTPDPSGDDFNTFGAANPTRVGDTTAPTIDTLSPVDDATDVALDANLVITFSEAVVAGTGNIVITDATDGSSTLTIPIGDGQITFAGSMVTIDPAVDLDPSTAYHVQMAHGVIEDAAGNDFAGITDATTWNFSTAAPPTFKLQVLHASDLEGGVEAIQNAPNFAAIVDTFEQDVSAFDASILLSAGDNYIPGPFFSAANDQATFRDGGIFNDTYNTLFGTTAYDSLREAGGRVDVSIMNVLGFDASAIGNHEFDAGPSALFDIIANDFRGGTDGPTGDRWVGAQFPYLSANLDFSGDSDLAGLFTTMVLASTEFASGPAESLAGTTNIPKLAPFTVIEEGGESIGVIGATTQLLASISSPGGVTGTAGTSNDMQALADILNPQIATLQRGIDGTAGNADDINKIILVSHLQQFSLEQDLIGRLNGVDIVIAGGSDTLLADGNDRLRAGDTAGDQYPLFTTNLDTDPAVIVSTDGEYSYVGRLIVEFDPAGVIIAPTAAELAADANVIGAFPTDEQGVLDVTGAASVADAIAASTKATEVEKLTDAVRSVVIAKDSTIAGRVGVFLEGRREAVRTQETNMGNLTADANLVAAQAVDPAVQVSIKNGGGIRAEIGTVDGFTGELLPTSANATSGKQAGEVSQLDIENTLKFNNELSLVTVTAGELVQILEHAVSATGPGATPGQFPQVGGLSFSFDPGEAAGSRVQSLAIIDELGNVVDPILDSGTILGDVNRPIRMVTLNFLAGGGDGYDFDPNGDGAGQVDTGIGEQTALADYLTANHSVVPYYTTDTPVELDRRIQNLDHREDTVLNEVATEELPLTHISTLELGGAEISAFDPATNRLFVTTGDGLEVVDFSDPHNPTQITLIDPTASGGGDTGVTSVAVGRGISAGIVAISVPETPDTTNGDVLFYDTATLAFLGHIEVGALPDMLTFTPDGTRILVANEGESADPEENAPSVLPNPNGSVSIITLDIADLPNSAVSTFDFSDPSITFDSLEAVGVRVNRDAPSAAADLEPEYITIEGVTAYITLQENNAVAVIDDVTNFAGFDISSLLPLGTKDHSLPFNALDASNRDDGIVIRNLPIQGLYMPDAIDSYQWMGQTFFVTANEGDGRGDADASDAGDEARVKDYGDTGFPALDPDALLFSADVLEDEVLGRIKSSTIDGDTDGDGDIDEIHVFGGRSFSIWDASGNQVWDSGSFLERLTAVEIPSLFNSDGSDPGEFDDRSDDKGPEPEGITLAQLGGQTYAFVGLERVGGVMIFNVTNPSDVQFVDYIDYLTELPGNVAPEGLTFIEAADSPTGNPLMVITNEDSNTVATIELAPALTLTVDAAGITESGSATATVTRTGDTSSALVVNIANNDGSEVNHPATVTIPMNQTSVTFTVSGIDDSLIDGTQTVTLTAESAGFSSDSASLDVTDENSATVSIEGTKNAEEAGLVDGVFVVTSTFASESDVTVNYTVSGSATSGADFTALSGSVVIPADQTVGMIDIDVINDGLAEPVENLTITLESVDSVGDITVNPAEDADDILVISDDLRRIQVSPSTVTVSEDGTTATFDVTLGAQPSGNVVVTVVSDDTGEATVSDATLTFTPSDWNIPQTITVTGQDDGEADGLQELDIVLGIDTSASPAIWSFTPDVLVDVLNVDNEAPPAIVRLEDVTFFNEDATLEDGLSVEQTGQRSVIRRVQVVLEGETSGIDAANLADAFAVQNLTTGDNVGLAFESSTASGGRTVIVFSFAAGASADVNGLIDGNYELTITGGTTFDADNSGSNGGEATIRFHRLFGDSDGDRDVDGADYGNFLQAYYGNASYRNVFDRDNDDDLFDEFGDFFANYGRRLAPHGM